MTTTPDSRIAHDFGLSPIDTSTTAGKIAVMQAYERGEACEWRPKQVTEPQVDWQHVGQQLQWNWCNTDYRIAPPVPARTALQAARECRAGMTVVNVASPDGRLCALLREIDKAHTITAYPSDFGTTEFKFSAGAVPPGRYRLVRDDD